MKVIILCHKSIAIKIFMSRAFVFHGIVCCVAHLYFHFIIHQKKGDIALQKTPYFLP